jgi:hypothetical protein
MSSAEYAEWRAFYQLVDAQQAGDEALPAPDELSAKIHQWAEQHKAKDKG